MTERDLAARIAAVRERIAGACARVGRDPAGVTLVAVSKTFPASDIAAAFAAGLRDFGENRVQEALPKIDELAARDVRPAWHLVGHIQTNKARAAAERFDILHGVDSLRIASALNRATERPLRVLLEVNVAGEVSKHGIAPAEVTRVAAEMRELPHIELLGLMTVAPRAENPEDVRGIFRQMRELRDSLGLRELSMGMTDDFEVAIEEGATIVRVGRAIFGERPRA